MEGTILKVNEKRVLVGSIKIEGKLITDHCWIKRLDSSEWVVIGSSYSRRCEVARYTKGYTLNELQLHDKVPVRVFSFDERSAPIAVHHGESDDRVIKPRLRNEGFRK